MNTTLRNNVQLLISKYKECKDGWHLDMGSYADGYFFAITEAIGDLERIVQESDDHERAVS